MSQAPPGPIRVAVFDMLHLSAQSRELVRPRRRTKLISLELEQARLALVRADDVDVMYEIGIVRLCAPSIQSREQVRAELPIALHMKSAEQANELLVDVSRKQERRGPQTRLYTLPLRGTDLTRPAVLERSQNSQKHEEAEG